MRRLALASPLLVIACSFSPNRPETKDLVACGNGVVEAGELCDDAGSLAGDGCSATCEVEAGWVCDDAEPTACLNPLPTANPDAVDVIPGGTVTAQVLENDTDPQGQGLRVVNITTPTFGTASIEVGTNIVFEAGATRGVDRIEYTIENASGQRAATTLTVRVGVDNRPPTAENFAASTTIDVELELRLRGSDPDGDPVFFQIVSPPAVGSLTGPIEGVVRYRPPVRAGGTDVFTYVATDGALTSAEAAVTITIAEGEWWSSEWTMRREVAIDTFGFAPSSGVPVRIPLDTGSLRAEGARPDGADLRFVTIDGTELRPHELVVWDTSAAAAWVRLPSVRPPKASLWMYYGNPSASPIDGSLVWSLDHDAVFHLERSLRDSVSGTDSLAPHAYVDAIAGTGIEVGFREVVRPPIPNRIRGAVGNLCAWLSIDSNARDRTIWRIEGNSSGSGSGNSLSLRVEDDRRWRLRIEDDLDTTGSLFADDGWHLACLQWNRATNTLELYIDGALDIFEANFEMRDIDQLGIGRDNEDDSYRGPFDELWIGSERRSADFWRSQFLLTTEPRVTVGQSERYSP